MKTKQINKTQWKEVELGEVCAIRKGKSITKATLTGGNVPVIAGGQQPAYYHNECNREGETITVSGSGAYAGFVAHFDIPIFASDCSTIQTEDKTIFMKYVYYFLKSRQKNIYDLQKGIAQPHIYPKQIQKIKIPLPFKDGKPDLQTQKQIVAVLEKAENLKQKQKKALELYGEYLKSIFWEMFLKEAGKSKIVKLKDIAKFINGRAFKPSEWENSGKLIIRIQDLTGSIDKPNYTTKTFDNRYLIKKGDLLISWSATLDTFIWTKEEGWLNQHIFKVVEDKNFINKTFLFYLIKTKIEEMKKNTHGSTMKHITKRDFDSIKIPLPPLPLQQKFASIVEKVEKLKEKQKKSLGDSEELFNALMQRAFNGGLD